jgi:hypothetical protein
MNFSAEWSSKKFCFQALELCKTCQREEKNIKRICCLTSFDSFVPELLRGPFEMERDLNNEGIGARGSRNSA